MRLKILVFVLFCSSLALGQTVSVTGTVTDPDGIAWANGSATFTLYNTTGIPPKLNGVPMTPSQLTVVAPLNGSAAFSTGLSDNTKITPVGTEWAYQICSAATSPCQTFPLFVASGSTLNLTTAISAVIKPIRIPAAYNTQAYADLEISPLPPPGGTYFNLVSTVIRFWNGAIWAALGAGGGGGSVPSAPANSVQFANSSVTAFQGNANLTFDPTVNRLYDNANMLVNALESLPRAVYDPMDTRYNGGLAAAIAGSSGFTPTQVIQAAIDYGQCQIQTGATSFKAEEIVLPSGITINITGLKLWSNTSFGGENSAVNPVVQHVDSSQPMIQAHANGDVLTCGGSTYTPASGGVGAVLIHDISIAGMFAPATNNDIGIELNMFGSIAKNIRGANQAFGGPAIISNGTSTFMFHIGTQGAQLQGCKTYNTGVLPVSGFTLGGGRCASVMDGSLDGGMADIYASDGQAFATGHAAGPCYPNCAAVSAGGSGTFDDQIFAQVSGVGIRIDGANIKSHNLRIDDTSREAIQFSGGSGGSVAEMIKIDSACVDTALQPNYNAGIATGCNAINVASGNGYHVQGVDVFNNAGIFSTAFVQCWFTDNNPNGSGASSYVDDLYFQGFPGNTSANNWAVCGGNNQTGPRYYLPAMPGMSLNGSFTSLNASGLSNVILNGQTINTITGGTTGQHLTVIGNGTIQATNNIFNLNGLDSSIVCNSGDFRSCSQALEYVNTNPSGTWVQIVGPPNQTPTHINYSGNPTVTNGSLLDTYGNQNFRQMPNFTISGAIQLFGPNVSTGQYCYEQEQVWPDGTHVVSSLTCSIVDITDAGASGEIFKYSAPQTVDSYLWLVSNTTGSSVPIGKYPSHAFWVPTVLTAGGDGTTAPVAGENTTGYPFLPFGAQLNTYSSIQPPCIAAIRGQLWLVSGGGTSPDVYQGCIQTGTSTYAWSNIGLAISGTTGFVPVITGPGSTGNSHINETANAGYETFTQGIIIDDTSGAGGFAIGTEGAEPAGCSITGAGCWWFDLTSNSMKLVNNAAAPTSVVGIATPGTAGNCPQFATGGTTLTDSGAPCGGSLTSPTPTYVYDAGAGTAPAAAVFAPGSNDFNGFLTFSTGTCSGGVCPVSSGIITIKFSTTYATALKCGVQASNQTTLSLANNVQPYIPANAGTTALTVVSSQTTGLPQSTIYQVHYWCGF